MWKAEQCEAVDGIPNQIDPAPVSVVFFSLFQTKPKNNSKEISPNKNPFLI
jgi:hypothetical protein